jgi:hypothetical protein
MPSKRPGRPPKFKTEEERKAAKKEQDTQAKLRQRAKKGTPGVVKQENSNANEGKQLLPT